MTSLPPTKMAIVYSATQRISSPGRRFLAHPVECMVERWQPLETK